MRPNPDDTIRRFFAGLTEYAFMSRLGVPDPPLVDYVAELLTRFLRSDEVYGIRDPSGRRPSGMARMLAEAELRIGHERRQIHRHIGDFALFWAGLYPEALELTSGPRGEDFKDYCLHGKRAYYVASTIEPVEDDPPSDVLLQLSTEFEACVDGLSVVRREWERRDPAGEGGGPVLLN